MLKNFSIEKWYMDCIDLQGNTFIGYSALLKWGRVNLNYSSQILYTINKGIEEKNSIRKIKSPIFKDGTLQWEVSYTNSKGKWKSLDPCIENALLKSEKGNIDWYCLQPKAEAEVVSLNNFIFKGFGYTEKLKMTIKPWELPISQLRWGRFLSDLYSIIWINWVGSKPLNLVYINGTLIPDAKVQDHLISSKKNNLELVLTDSVTIREGSIISTALGRFPKLHKIFPKQFLMTVECKWRSKGILKLNNLETSSGWAIHEIVKWD